MRKLKSKWIRFLLATHILNRVNVIRKCERCGEVLSVRHNGAHMCNSVIKIRMLCPACKTLSGHTRHGKKIIYFWSSHPKI